LWVPSQADLRSADTSSKNNPERENDKKQLEDLKLFEAVSKHKKKSSSSPDTEVTQDSGQSRKGKT